MPYIQTSNGKIHYTTYPLYVGVKRIDKQIARENLLLFKKIVDSYHISFGLIAGTLLGAVREHDFIEHDEDIDLFLKEEDKRHLFDILPQLLDNDFEIARYDRRGLISIIRKGEYIDLYFFSEYGNDIRICSGWCIPACFLTELTELSFQDALFKVPKNYIAYLEFEYGESWHIPIPYANFEMPRWRIIFFKIKEKIKDILPDWLYFYWARKSEADLKEYYMKKIDIYRKSNPL